MHNEWRGKREIKNEQCVVDLTRCAMIFELINTVLHDIIKVYTGGDTF